MATVPPPTVSPFDTLEQVMASVSDVPASRIRINPMPGTATEDDILRLRSSHGVLCELVDGVLVEKGMGHNESIIAGYILTAINVFLEKNNLGLAAGEAGMFRLKAGQIRMPDVSFVSWDQLPGRVIPEDAIWNTYPDLAVEVISSTNTKAEIIRKISEYFEAGSRLIWVVDPPRRNVSIYTSQADFTVADLDDRLSGGNVLPGFEVAVDSIFRAWRV